MGEIEKKKILDNATYSEIVTYINEFDGLPMDCGLELHKVFSGIDGRTLESILSTEIRRKVKSIYHKWAMKSSGLALSFDKKASTNPYKSDIVVNMAKETGLTPSMISRLLIAEKFKNKKKSDIADILKKSHLIPDPSLALNIQSGICSDNLDGPIADMIRRYVGEEFEIRLKDQAKQAGLHYLDEAVLRRTGFDKTPDLKLAIPCLYKGKEVNWIESKALFGDTKTHRQYLVQQLSSYSNRFGPGIIIYWFGYQEEIHQLQENSEGLIILDDFPDKSHIELLEIK
ncbi:CDAN1-interacting nuclease 1 [Condylostylus longicornis]|uniref:CDAN1-interacting nuclease 1 n=1 Tax=Condylostylus longicornis TaxID=2530218 RepID=UPI00244DA62F|nr:CDAN1-interacting nuclease 1 [Condylostylus longicornis]